MGPLHLCLQPCERICAVLYKNARNTFERAPRTRFQHAKAFPRGILHPSTSLHVAAWAGSATESLGLDAKLFEMRWFFVPFHAAGRIYEKVVIAFSIGTVN